MRAKLHFTLCYITLRLKSPLSVKSLSTRLTGRVDSPLKFKKMLLGQSRIASLTHPVYRVYLGCILQTLFLSSTILLAAAYFRYVVRVFVIITSHRVGSTVSRDAITRGRGSTSGWL